MSKESKLLQTSAALASFVAIALFSLPAEAVMHATKEFESGATRPRTIVFLPPHVDVIRRKIVHAEQQLDQSTEFAGHLRASLFRRQFSPLSGLLRANWRCPRNKALQKLRRFRSPHPGESVPIGIEI